MRPQFHFTAKRGWINDPHGITFHEGRYHQFHQFVPDSMVWQPDCRWGHAAGSDLFSLEHRRVALAPGDGDDGIWTGSLVIDDAGMTRIFYTSVVQPDIGIGRIRVATPLDADWNSWLKGDLLIEAPTELPIIAYRDPFVFRDGPQWRMYVGAGLNDGTATALGYISKDLEHWTLEGIAAQRSTNEREPVWMGALWECPQLIEIAGRHVLVSSVWDADVLYYAGYGIGSVTGGEFSAETWGRLTYGPSYYAPSFFRDSAGRPCLMFWMRGVADAEAGWSSAHSIPYVLGLQGDRLTATPHPDLERYRHDGSALGNAVDLVWMPGTGGTLTVAEGHVPRCVITASAELVRVVVEGTDPLECPRVDDGQVRIIIDGPVLEIVTDGVLLGSSIPPIAEITIQASGMVEIHPLINVRRSKTAAKPDLD